MTPKLCTENCHQTALLFWACNVATWPALKTSLPPLLTLYVPRFSKTL